MDGWMDGQPLPPASILVVSVSYIYVQYIYNTTQERAGLAYASG